MIKGDKNLSRLLDEWTRMSPRDREVLVTVACALTPKDHPTVQVSLPKSASSAKFDKIRFCPECKIVIPPRAHKEHWSFCPDCGCPLPVWDWQT